LIFIFWGDIFFVKEVEINGGMQMYTLSGQEFWQWQESHWRGAMGHFS
jgi:hypothetical protein